MPQGPSLPSPHGSETNQPGITDVELEKILSEVERSLQALKERYEQIKRDQQRQVQLQRHQEQLKQQLRNNSDRQQLQAQLRQIKEQLGTIEFNLESQLFSWGSLKEPFWQAVRFGGIGVVIGWLLKSCAG